MQLNGIEMNNCFGPLPPTTLSTLQTPKIKMGPKNSPIWRFPFNSNCYSTEEPNSSFEEIYLLVRFAVMIIIVTVRKNTLIVSSELTMLHKHDLISPPVGQVLLTLRTGRSDAVQCLEQGHTSRWGGTMGRPQVSPLGPRALCNGLGSLV